MSNYKLKHLNFEVSANYSICQVLLKEMVNYIAPNHFLSAQLKQEDGVKNSDAKRLTTSEIKEQARYK
jgi:hypothetical protein